MRIVNAKDGAPSPTPPRARQAEPVPVEAPGHAEAPAAEAVEAAAPAAPAEAPTTPPPSMPRVLAPLPERAAQALRHVADELLIAQAVMIGHPLRRQISAAVDHVEAILVAHGAAQAQAQAQAEAQATTATDATSSAPEATPPAASSEPEAAAVKAPESKRK